MTEPRFDCPSCARAAALHCHHSECKWLICRSCLLTYNAYELDQFFLLQDVSLVSKNGEVYLRLGA